MRQPFLLLLLFFIMLGTLTAQQPVSVVKIKMAFEDFEYRRVTQLADSVLKADTLLAVQWKNEILLLKALSHYSLSEENQAKKSFIEILNNDRAYVPDSAIVSPKILALFMIVKEDYQAIKPEETKTNPLVVPVIKNSDEELKQALEQFRIYNSAVSRSLIFPGWGHLTLGESTKGIVLASVGAITLGSMLYYIINSNSYEKEYLGAIDPAEIRSSYEKYNNAYRMRNIFIASFAAVWLYAQGDILLGSQPASKQFFLRLAPVTDGLRTSGVLQFTFYF